MSFTVSLSAAEKKTYPAPNYDENKIPLFKLPDPLIAEDGSKITSEKQWTEKRRAEILHLFEENVYGKCRLDKVKMKAELLESEPAFNGTATRWQFQLTFYIGNEPAADSPKAAFLLYTPKNADKAAQDKETLKKTPVFLGLNFMGNHACHTDPGIFLAKTIWDRGSGKPESGKEDERGKQIRRWNFEMLTWSGVAVGTVYYGDIEPDYNGGIKNGVRRLIYGDIEKEDGVKPAPNDGNAISTWAWGLSKMLDLVIEFQDKLNIDPEKTCVIGHSRLGKTSLWAGATDPRFAVTISNDSGCGGAALSRREIGETVERINGTFPHWFCDNFKKYNKSVNDLPVDQHELLALIAPRGVCVASATEDIWADPKGEFLSCYYADPVYRLFGTNGFNGAKEQPKANEGIGGIIHYHLREGKHDILDFDWQQYIDYAHKHFADKHSE
ncbi:acetylxylan esterase [Planctomycetales bacterium]|nr:acetylxylan esterase [Planctomycetales bacterium]